MKRKIHLYGRAAVLFGKEPFELNVDTIPEAIRALCCQLKGFLQFIEAHDFHIVKGKSRKTGMTIEADFLPLMLGDADVHIMPATHVKGGGGKGAGIAKLIAGVLLAGFAFFVAPVGFSMLGMSANQIGMIGIGLAAQGLSTLMSPNEEKEDRTSNIFGSAPDMAEQGRVLPVIYGTDRIDDPAVISAGIDTRKVKA